MIMQKCLALLLIVIAILIAEGSEAQVCSLIEPTAYAHHIDAKLLQSIITVESRLKVSAVNHKTHDYGLGQINKRTIASYHFDKDRLLTDEQYSLDATASVLRDFHKQYHKREPQTWMCRYNVGGGPLVGKKAENCLKYLNKLRKVAKCVDAMSISITSK